MFVSSVDNFDKIYEKIWKKSKMRPRLDKKEYKKKDWNWTEIEQQKSPNRKGTKKVPKRIWEKKYDWELNSHSLDHVLKSRSKNKDLL